MDESNALGPLVRNDNTPVFEEGWQAQVLSLAFHLVERGQFTSAQWSDALGAELAGANERGEADDPATYYQAVLHALEGLLDSQQSVSKVVLNERTEAWRNAYLHTPHGKPVEL